MWKELFICTPYYKSKKSVILSDFSRFRSLKSLNDYVTVYTFDISVLASNKNISNKVD